MGSADEFVDAKVFFRLEDWQLDPEDQSKTIYLKRMRTYQRNMARMVYKTSGGDEERANNLFISSHASTMNLLKKSTSNRDQEHISADFCKKIHTAYLDALYAFLDGLMQAAVSEPQTLEGLPANHSDALAPPAILVSRSRSAHGQAESGPEKLNIYDRVGHSTRQCDYAG